MQAERCDIEHKATYYADGRHERLVSDNSTHRGRDLFSFQSGTVHLCAELGWRDFALAALRVRSTI